MAYSTNVVKLFRSSNMNIIQCAGTLNRYEPAYCCNELFTAFNGIHDINPSFSNKLKERAHKRQ